MLEQELARSSLDGCELQRGSIVNVGSVMSVVGKPISTGNVASKYGAPGLMRAASEDYAAKGLRMNTICLGYVQTPMLDAVARNTSQEVVERKVPTKRLGTPEEIADCVLFLSGGDPLSSRESHFVWIVAILNGRCITT